MLVIHISKPLFSADVSNVKLQKLTQVKRTLPALYQYGCDTWYQSAELMPCSFGEDSSKKKAVIFGDSVLAQWVPALVPVFLNKDWQVIVLTKSSCPIVNEPYYNSRLKSTFIVCDQWKQKAFKYIQKEAPDMLIIGNTSTYPYSKKEWQSGVLSTVELLKERAKQVKVFLGTPLLGFNGPDCLSRKYLLANSFLPQASSACQSLVKAIPSNQWIKQALQNDNKVGVLTMNNEICPDFICFAEKDGLIVYRDNQHLSVEYVKSLSPIINEVIFDDDLE